MEGLLRIIARYSHVVDHRSLTVFEEHRKDKEIEHKSDVEEKNMNWDIRATPPRSALILSH